MTDEQIIKALECCGKDYSCEKCILNTWLNKKRDCVGKILGNALDLIIRQKAEIEKLQKENERWKNGFMGACLLENCTLKDEWKSEAIKEFAERLKETAYSYSDISGYSSIVVDADSIDNLVKEMEEKNNVNKCMGKGQA